MVPYVCVQINNTKIRLNDINRVLYPGAKSNKFGAGIFMGLRFLKEYVGLELGAEAVTTSRLTEDVQLRISNTTADLMAFIPL